MTKLMNIEKGLDMDNCWDAITHEMGFEELCGHWREGESDDIAV